MEEFSCPDLKVFHCGLVVHHTASFLEASPDGKVLDPHSPMSFGLIEIKCAFANHGQTLEQKCNADKSFYLKMVDGEFRINRDMCSNQGRMYFAQIQGQLARTGLPYLYILKTTNKWLRGKKRQS